MRPTHTLLTRFSSPWFALSLALAGMIAGYTFVMEQQSASASAQPVCPCANGSCAEYLVS